MSIEMELKEVLKEAVQKAFDISLEPSSIVIETPKNKNHGDYSSNVAMQLTRQLRQNPRVIAQAVIDAMRMDSMIEKVEIAGPG
ncbi:MAG: arginine--tRNA ligase, partial [Erysipelotrichaceae bacterium]|nr:arginine--tRNA ligase [Erysipelotrichaceae bacterium]